MEEDDDAAAAAEAPDAAGAGVAATGRGTSELRHESVRVLLDAGERLRLPQVRLLV